MTWEGTKHQYVSLQVICGIVCVLSILGSLAIIVTYALVKEVRSKARELLVHISLMDITYTMANFIGLIIPYRKHLHDDNGDNSTSYSNEDHRIYQSICEVQAFFAIYGTIGSVLWTLALAVYLYYRIVSRDPTVTKRLLMVLYVICYMMPLYVSLWLLLDHHMGYPHSALSGAGWCSLRNDGKDSEQSLVTFMTYDIWIWLGIIVLVPLYLVIHVHIRQQVKITGTKQSHLNYWIADELTAVTKADRKLLLIPLMFIFLRVWDIVDSILFVYLSKKTDSTRTHYYWLQLFTAIGDSGQGFINFIIFFLFQPMLRKFLVANICRCCCRRRSPGRHTQYDDGSRDENEGIGDHDISRTPEHFDQNTLSADKFR